MHPKLQEAVERNQLSSMADPEHLVDWRLLLALEALDEAGVLAQLPGNVEQIAAQLGLDASATAAALQVLVGWQLLERQDRYFTWTQPQLTDEQLAVLIQHGVWIRRWAANLGPRLRDSSATSLLAPSARPAAKTLQALQTATQGAIEPVVQLCWDALAPTISKRPRILDLGGGHGAHALALQARGADVVLQDLPPVIDGLSADPRFQHIELVPGNMHDQIAPGSFDLILLASVTNMFRPAAVQALLQRAAKHLKPAGVLVVVTHLRERSAVAAAFGVQMLVGPGGDAHGEADYRQWLTQARLEWASLHQLSDPPLTVIITRKPGL